MLSWIAEAILQRFSSYQTKTYPFRLRKLRQKEKLSIRTFISCASSYRDVKGSIKLPNFRQINQFKDLFARLKVNIDN